MWTANKSKSVNPNRTLHDPDRYWGKKMEKSTTYFKGTRVQTCSHVMVKNGKAVAVQFPLEKTGWKAKNSFQNTKRSGEGKSHNGRTYSRRSDLHAGMLKKPLEPYHPNAKRSRLHQPTIVMPYKNSSSIVLGDRSSDIRRAFATTNKTFYNKHNTEDPTEN